jgi:riboflavin-specific deaminase-like protein
MSAAESLDLIRSASADRPFVVAQLGQSLDGRIATPTGDSRWINGEDALDHLHALRAAVDAVIVGVGTVIADDPQLTVRRVAGRHPARVVIDPTGRAPADSRCFADDGTPSFRIACQESEAPPGVVPVVLTAQDRCIQPAAIIATLFGFGLRRILIEGGADTISRFIDADLVDRLHVLLAPVILGSGRSSLTLRPIDRLREAMRPAARVWAFADGDVLFDCDLRTKRAC